MTPSLLNKLALKSVSVFITYQNRIISLPRLISAIAGTNARFELPPAWPVTFFLAAMVKVEIVDEKDPQDTGSSPYGSPSSSRTSSSASLSSVSSELSQDETLYDRIAALVDIVPPSTRYSISTRLSAATSFIKRGTKLAGNIVWVVTTSALLIGLPLALTLEDEAKIVAQEQEMMAQQQGAQQVGFYILAKILSTPILLCLLFFLQMLGGQASLYPSPPGQNSQGPKGLVPPGF